MKPTKKDIEAKLRGAEKRASSETAHESHKDYAAGEAETLSWVLEAFYPKANPPIAELDTRSLRALIDWCEVNATGIDDQLLKAKEAVIKAETAGLDVKPKIELVWPKRETR